MRPFSVSLLVLFMACAACGTDETQDGTDNQETTDESTDTSTNDESTTDDSDTTPTDETNPDETTDPETDPETDPDPTDETDNDIRIGSDPTSCGQEAQGLEPVDCTMHGDVNAYCVFSNHCACSEGFECETPFNALLGQECAPGSVCLPVN